MTTIDDLFNEEKLYYHCSYCGDIYDGGWDKKVLYNNGAGEGLGKEFKKYQISSGICKVCYGLWKVENEEKKKR